VAVPDDAQAESITARTTAASIGKNFRRKIAS
jgi:hypothetical protein